MKRLIFIITICISVFSCNNENAAPQKELAINEKDTTLNDTTVHTEQVKQKPDTTVTSSINKAERKLRYLFYANGGLIGYFDDGTVAACPRCDLMKENIKALYTAKPFKKYTIEKNGSLLVNDNEYEYPKEKDENGNKEWAMIDYKWLVDL